MRFPLTNVVRFVQNRLKIKTRVDKVKRASQSWTLHLNYKSQMNGSDPEKLGCVCFDKIGACDKLQALMKGRENGDGYYLKEQHRWE